MRALCHAHSQFITRALMVLSAALLLVTVPMAGQSSAHGSTIDPASRNYGCLDRWGDRWQAPEMQTEDPMCHQAWQADPSAMWNWNGLYRENVGGDHQAAIPDGQLCSGGRTQGGRYAAMDAVGDWVAKDIRNDFTVKVHDAAKHGADYFRIYVTKPGFDPRTEALGWDDLELVRETGEYAPGAGTPETGNSELGGVTVSVDASVQGRTGRAIVYTIWQAAHLDQPYYLCSDVNFVG